MGITVVFLIFNCVLVFLIMRLYALLFLVVFVSGCLPSVVEESETTELGTSTTTSPLVTTTKATTYATQATTTTAATTTTLPTILTLPEYTEGYSLTYATTLSEAGRGTYNNSLEFRYAGVSDSGQMIFDRRYSGLRARPGQSMASVVSSFRHFYRFNGSVFVLEKSVSYPRASTGASTTFSYSQGKVELMFPLKVGLSWNGSTLMVARKLNRQRYKLTVNYSYRVVSVKTVSTPAGDFNCLKVENTEEEYLGSRLLQTRTRVLYYCPKLKYYGSWKTDTEYTLKE